MFTWLFRRRRAPCLQHVHIRMYTRAGCHLCEDAWTLLTKAQVQHGFVLEAVDVDTDPALAAQFGDCVPVVTVNDKVRFRGGVNGVLLQRLLRAEGPKHVTE